MSWFSNRVEIKGAVVMAGGSRGIGKEVAFGIAAKGVTVFASVRTQEAGDKLLAEAKEKSIPTLHTVMLDVTSQESCDKAAAYVEEALKSMPNVEPHVHAAMVCAGTFDGGVLELVGADRCKAVNEIQVYGTIRLMSAFGPLMRKGPSPRLVLSSSPAGYAALPCFGPNVISRHATEGMAKCFALEGKAWPNPLQVCLCFPLGVTDAGSAAQGNQVEQNLSAFAVEHKSADSPMNWASKAAQAFVNMNAMMKAGKIPATAMVPGYFDAISLKTVPFRSLLGMGFAQAKIMGMLPTEMQLAMVAKASKLA